MQVKSVLVGSLLERGLASSLQNFTSAHQEILLDDVKFHFTFFLLLVLLFLSFRTCHVVNKYQGSQRELRATTTQYGAQCTHTRKHITDAPQAQLASVNSVQETTLATLEHIFYIPM